jgi:hypothetical protein
MVELALQIVFCVTVVGFLICGIFATTPRPKILK